MNRVLILFTLVMLVGASEAEATTVRLHAGHRVQRWESKALFNPHAVISDEVVVEGHSLPTTTSEGCRVAWAGRGVAVLVNTCGVSPAPIRLHYVSFGERKTIRFTYRRLRRFAP